MICTKCYNDGVASQALGNTFYYCRTCKEEIQLEVKPRDGYTDKELYQYVNDTYVGVTEDDFKYIRGPFPSGNPYRYKKPAGIQSQVALEMLEEAARNHSVTLHTENGHAYVAGSNSCVHCGVCAYVDMYISCSKSKEWITGRG